MKEQHCTSSMEKSYRIPYAEALNPSQFDAVFFNDGPLLVIAGAGSGKTRTLTYRVARLVEDGIAPGSILLLTFTRKSAQEMLRRASFLLDGRCEKVAGGTFHSFSNAVLKRYASLIGYDSGFRILDRSDSEEIIGMLRKELAVVPTCHGLPRKQTLATMFSRAVNKSLSLEEVILNDYLHFEHHIEEILSIYQGYKRRKVENHLFDYDDLLTYLRFLLEEHPDIRKKLSLSYHYIMVDEYQDTNKIQAEIIRLLADTHENVMVVGDDSQSIYAFRGANFKNIMEFPNIFPEAQIIKLEENYRSVQPILTLTNIMIDRAREKYTKTLFTRKAGGSVPVLVDTATEKSQSRFVVDKILEFHHEGVPLRQIAVLFRAGYHSFDLEIELNRQGISFVKFGGFKFMESAHIKDMLAHLRVISTPYDRLSWYRILLLLDHIGPKTAVSIYEAILKAQAGYSGFLNIKHKSQQHEGMNRLRDLCEKMASKPMTVSEAGEAVFNYYAPILKERYDDHPKRTRDLEHLLTIMFRYQSLDAFLADMALEPPSASVDNDLSIEDGPEDRLVLSTVHSAKGLEWHTVFIIWVLDGRFPSIHALNNEDEIEEELRLLYVAATRARENLFFSYPMQIYDARSQMMLSRPSRFLDMMPDSILEKYTVWE